jgi:hypothetical protein
MGSMMLSSDGPRKKTLLLCVCQERALWRAFDGSRFVALSLIRLELKVQRVIDGER